MTVILSPFWLILAFLVTLGLGTFAGWAFGHRQTRPAGIVALLVALAIWIVAFFLHP